MPGWLIALAALTPGTTFYLSTGGNDGNTCAAAQSVATPRRTLSAGIACLQGGDTLKLASGTYVDRFTGSIASGPSRQARTSIEGEADGGTLIVNSDNASNTIHLSPAAMVQNVAFRFLHIDGQGCTYVLFLNGPGYLLEDLEIFNSSQTCIYHGQDTGGSTFAELRRLDVHDCARGALRFGGDDNLLEDSVLRPRGNGNVMTLYEGALTVNRSIVRRNRFEGSAQGFYVSAGAGNVVASNIFRFISADHGISITGGVTGLTVINNTIDSVSGAGIFATSGSRGIKVSNNWVSRADAGIAAAGAMVTQTTNLFSSLGFVDLDGGDLRPLAASAAHDLGTTEPEASLDIAGVARPQGCAYDIGAYERLGPCADGGSGAGGGSGGGTGGGAGGAAAGGAGGSTGGGATNGGGRPPDGARAYAVGCGCDAASPLLLPLAWLVRRRRTSHKP